MHDEILWISDSYLFNYIFASCRYLYQLINLNGWLPRRQEAEDETCKVPGKKKSGETKSAFRRYTEKLISSMRCLLLGVEAEEGNRTETSALVTHQEVRDWGDGRRDAMIVSVSHAWETREHPDPCRFQLQNLVHCLKLYDAAYSSDLWIFFDYTSLFQWRRDANHELSYQRAMRNVQVLYAHRSTLTFRMECLTPEAIWTAAENDPTFKVPVYHGPSKMVVPLPLKELVRNSNLYLVRGWCLAEREWSASRSVQGQNIVIDGGSEEDQEIKKIPTSPDVFNKRMAESVFTHRVDCESVIELQKKIFFTKVTICEQLGLNDLTNADVDELLASLPHYRNLKILKIHDFSASEEQVIPFVEVTPTSLYTWISFFTSLFFRNLLSRSCFFFNNVFADSGSGKSNSTAGVEFFAIGDVGATGSRRFCRQRTCLGPGQVTVTPCFLWTALIAPRPQALAAMLKDNKSLKELVLLSCLLGDAGVEAPGCAFFEGASQFELDFTFATHRPWPMLCSTTTPSPSSSSLVNIRPSFAFLKVFLFHEILFLAPEHWPRLPVTTSMFMEIRLALPVSRPSEDDFRRKCVGRSEESLLPGATLREALERIETRLRANEEAAAEAAWKWTLDLGLLWNSYCLLSGIMLNYIILN